MAKFKYTQIDRVRAEWEIEAPTLAEAKAAFENGNVPDAVETFDDTEDYYWTDEDDNILEEE